MPPDADSVCRAAWALLTEEPRAIVHGGPGGPNIPIAPEGVGPLNRNEARVDAAILDRAALPPDLSDRLFAVPRTATPERQAAARHAAGAWEAANGWLGEPAYASRDATSAGGGVR